MAAAGLLPCVGTFFVFSDYMRPAVRLASIDADEGRASCGPTTRSASVRTARRTSRSSSSRRCGRCRACASSGPADANEVAAAWKVHLDGEGPTALVLTRQKVPVLERTAERAPPGFPRARTCWSPEHRDRLDLVLIGTGSEVAGVRRPHASSLRRTGIAARVVSMPSWSLFESRPDEYRHEVLPPGVPTLAVEAGVSFGWERYADDVVGIDRFGASAPGDVVMRELGITPEHVVERALALLDAIGEGGS